MGIWGSSMSLISEMWKDISCIWKNAHRTWYISRDLKIPIGPAIFLEIQNQILIDVYFWYISWVNIIMYLHSSLSCVHLIIIYLHGSLPACRTSCVRCIYMAQPVFPKCIYNGTLGCFARFINVFIWHPRVFSEFYYVFTGFPNMCVSNHRGGNLV